MGNVGKERRASRRHTAFSELADDLSKLDVASQGRPSPVRRASATPLPNPFSQAYVPPAVPADAASDVSMEDVSATPLLNAPALPSAPVFKGSTMADRRRFMRKYTTYVNALNAFQSPVHRPFVMPARACIDGDTRRRIAMFTFGCDPDKITEEQWWSYFVEAQKPVVRNYLAVDDAMRSLKMDVRLAEAASRVSRLQDDLYKILEKHNFSEEMFQEDQPRIVRYLLEALEPAPFRETVRHQLSMETHKAKRRHSCRSAVG